MLFLVYLYLLILFAVSTAAVLAVWPNGPHEFIVASERLSAEMRLLLLVIAGAILGTSLTGVASLTADIVNRTQPRRPLWIYALDFMVAVPMSLTLYLAVRGLIVSPSADATDLNPSGLAALSMLVGLYGPQWLLSIGTMLTWNKTQVDERLESISSALGVAKLENYRGHVCLALYDASGNRISHRDDGQYLTAPGTVYRLKVWFDLTAPEDAISQRVEISGGTDVTTVNFSLNADCDMGRLDHRSESVSFGVTGRSEDVVYTLTTARGDSGTGRVWVEVLQKNRLVEVISADLVAL